MNCVSLNYGKDLISDNFNELSHTIIKLSFVCHCHSNSLKAKFFACLTIHDTPQALICEWNFWIVSRASLRSKNSPHEKKVSLLYEKFNLILPITSELFIISQKFLLLLILVFQGSFRDKPAWRDERRIQNYEFNYAFWHSAC